MTSFSICTYNVVSIFACFCRSNARASSFVRALASYACTLAASARLVHPSRLRRILVRLGDPLPRSTSLVRLVRAAHHGTAAAVPFRTADNW